MADEEIWERPIGLTKEFAICVDDSDDDGESPDDDINRGSLDGHQSKVAREYTSSLTCGESRIGNASTSSYFQKGLNKNCNGTAPEIDSGGEERKIGNEVVRTDENEPPKTKDDDEAAKFEDVPTESLTAKNDAVENDNPFASFAFRAEESPLSSSSSSWRPKKRPKENNSTSTMKKKNSTKVAKQTAKKEKDAKYHSLFSKPPSAKNAIDSGSQARIDMADMQQQKKMERKQHRQELIAKWHAFADPNAPIEERRFQLLVAARLHARCQEQVVKKAMDGLRKYFDEKRNLDSACSDENSQNEERTGLLAKQALTESERQLQTQHEMSRQTPPQSHGLTIRSLSKSNPETEIAPLLSSVLFGNTKANQIVQAAKDILAKFGGRVPELMSGLKEITGIGPKLAEILSIVNKRESYS